MERCEAHDKQPRNFYVKLKWVFEWVLFARKPPTASISISIDLCAQSKFEKENIDNLEIYENLIRFQREAVVQIWKFIKILIYWVHCRVINFSLSHGVLLHEDSDSFLLLLRFKENTEKVFNLKYMFEQSLLLN